MSTLPQILPTAIPEAPGIHAGAAHSSGERNEIAGTFETAMAKALAPGADEDDALPRQRLAWENEGPGVVAGVNPLLTPKLIVPSQNPKDKPDDVRLMSNALPVPQKIQQIDSKTPGKSQNKEANRNSGPEGEKGSQKPSGPAFVNLSLQVPVNQIHAAAFAFVNPPGISEAAPASRVSPAASPTGSVTESSVKLDGLPQAKPIFIAAKTGAAAQNVAGSLSRLPAFKSVGSDDELAPSFGSASSAQRAHSTGASPELPQEKSQLVSSLQARPVSSASLKLPAPGVAESYDRATAVTRISALTDSQASESTFILKGLARAVPDSQEIVASVMLQTRGDSESEIRPGGSTSSVTPATSLPSAQNVSTTGILDESKTNNFRSQFPISDPSANGTRFVPSDRSVGGEAASARPSSAGLVSATFGPTAAAGIGASAIEVNLLGPGEKRAASDAHTAAQGSGPIQGPGSPTDEISARAPKPAASAAGQVNKLLINGGKTPVVVQSADLASPPANRTAPSDTSVSTAVDASPSGKTASGAYVEPGMNPVPADVVEGPPGDAVKDSTSSETPLPPADSDGTSVAKQDMAMKQAEKTNKIAGQTEKVLPGSAVPATRTNLSPTILSHGVQFTATVAASSSPSADTNVAATLPANVTSAPAAVDLHDRILDRAQNLVAFNNTRLSDSGNNSMQVVIKPDAGTQLSLELRQHGNTVEVQAVLQHGDFSHLNQQWSDLQHRLDQRGIRLAPLMDNGSGMSGRDSQNFQQKQQTQESIPDFPYLETSAGAFAPETANAQARRGWESWA